MNRHFYGLAMLATVAAFSVAMPASAEETIRLKISHGYPASHFLWEEGGKVLADEVTARTNGKVQYDVFPADQLGKDPLGILNSGLADIAIITPAYISAKMPLTAVTELPNMFSTSCEGGDKFQTLAADGGALGENEYKPLGLHVLYTYTAAPFALSTVSKEISTLDDVAGLKVRVAGGAMSKVISGLGGIPIQLAAPEIYDALSRGTLDAAMYSRFAVSAIKLEGVLKHSVDGVRLGSGAIVVATSEKIWNSWPEDVRAAMQEAADVARKNLCKWSDDHEAKATRSLVEENGWKINVLSPEQVAIWKDRLAAVSDAWAQELDGMGRPGTEVLEAMRNAKPSE